MALTAQSLFLYNYEVNEFNSSIDFRAVSLGPILMATIPFGSYSATGLMLAAAQAMKDVDPSRTYFITMDRTISSGTQNRVTISTSGTYLDILWSTGPRSATAAYALFGFTQTNQTGATTYTGTLSSGTVLIPDLYAYTYLGPAFMRTLFGTVSVTASGLKEAIVWNVQKFFQVEFKHQPYSKVVNEWTDFLTWAIEQRPLEFTPEITSPTVFYQATLEMTTADGKGLGYSMQEELPDLPFLYHTGVMKFRQIT